MITEERKHIPVMLSEVLDYLKPRDGETYVDATFGNGGYTQAVLEAADCRVIAIDRDPNVRARAEMFQKTYGSRFEFISGCFGALKELVTCPADGFVFDIGVSSMQLDEAERGFSFSKEAALDMRMSCEGLSALDIVNTYDEEALADLIYRYGEERMSRQIARRIVEVRKTKSITTTTELAQIIHGIVHKKFGETDPATRTFQALRIAVNDELGELERGLQAAVDLLRPDGRLVVVDFHSLEDRIVKNFFNKLSGKTSHVSRYLPQIENNEHIILTQVSKAIKPTAEECRQNPRARSAKLRFALKSPFLSSREMKDD